MPPILFCNIAWMKKYAGRNKNDCPIGGGRYVNENREAGEECNFVPCEDGYLYGHFETIKKGKDRKVRIEKLGASKTDDYLDGVDIVWTAPLKGNDPRVVVGWWCNARLYRMRQNFKRNFPSIKHKEAKIGSYIVKVKQENSFLIPADERKLVLCRGKPGWPGQASWWYADETKNPKAKEFVTKLRALMGKSKASSFSMHAEDGHSGAKRRTGAAASEPHFRYCKEFEAEVHPRHHELQEKFKSFLRKENQKVEFPQCYHDDLRYTVLDESPVMVEVKPTNPDNIRFAIRTAIGQLLDYKQDQKWEDRQLILVETKVTSPDDLSLARDNGFGLAWPKKSGRFKIIWP